jgi:hypothetical protein
LTKIAVLTALTFGGGRYFMAEFHEPMYSWQAISLKVVKTDQCCKMELKVLEKYYL